MGRKVKRSTRKRSTRKQRGRGIVDVLKKVHSAIKSRKLISRGLRLAGKPGLANAAAMAGYGRKKKKGTRKRSVGLKGSLGALLRSVKKPKRSTTMRGRGTLSGIAIKGRPGVMTMKGRGFFGKTLGGLAGGVLGGMLPF